MLRAARTVGDLVCDVCGRQAEDEGALSAHVLLRHPETVPSGV